MQTTYLLTYSDSGSTDSGNPLFGHGILENQIQALSKTFRHRFKDFQGTYEQYIKRTELNQTGTFVNIYKQVQFTFNNLTPSSINQKLELSEKMKAIHHSDTGYTDSENHLFGHGILENQIQVLLRTFKHRFKNFQGPCVLSRIF